MRKPGVPPARIPDGMDSGGKRLEIEADARHAEILIRDFNFGVDTKGCDVPEDKITPGELAVTEQQPVLVNGDEIGLPFNRSS